MIQIPLRTYSSLNERVHWRVRARRAKQQRETVGWELKRFEIPKLPCVVTLTRLSPGTLDDDNLAAALKHVRDEVARWIGIDDADPRIEWLRGQEKTKRGYYYVRIEVA